MLPEKEHQHIEWKESWRDEYLKWICGFANAEGGVLLIGRNDKGETVGVADAHKLLMGIPNKVRDILGIMVDVNLREENGKALVEIRVEPYPSPVSYKGEYHYRSGSTKQELKGAALDRFLLRKLGRHWDGVPVPYVGVDDLSAKALTDFRRQALKSQRLSQEMLAEPDAALLERLHLLEGAYLKRAALLLFHPDPERFVTGAYLKIGYFESDADLLYHDEVHGDLFSQVNQAIAVLKAKYLKALISYEGLQRVETYPVPESALREAVLNALVHKDYASAIPIQISVYTDKLMIWNPGQLPPDWTVERLLGKHASQPFNPDIANAFFRAGLIEAWGRGIERILRDCTLAGLLAPELCYERSGLWMVFHFTVAQPEVREGIGEIIQDVWGATQEIRDTTQETRGTTQETTQETRGTTQEIRDTTQETTQEKILVLLEEQPSMTRKALAEKLGISPDGIKYHLEKMRAAGIIRHEGSTKTGYWVVLK